MPEVLEHYRYWQEFPPLHLLVRAFVGFKPAPSKREGLADLKANVGRVPGVNATKISDLPDWARNPKPWPMNAN